MSEAKYPMTTESDPERAGTPPGDGGCIPCPKCGRTYPPEAELVGRSRVVTCPSCGIVEQAFAVSSIIPANAPELPPAVM